MAQNIRKLCYILFYRVKHPREKMAQIMGKHLFFCNARIPEKLPLCLAVRFFLHLELLHAGKGKPRKAQRPRSERFFGAFTISLYVISAVVAILSLVIIVKGIITPEKPPSVLGIIPVVMVNESMQSGRDGSISYGAAVFFKSAKPERYSEGDVIAFFEDGVIYVGRIESIASVGTDFCCTVKADNLSDPYPITVTSENTVGKAVLTVNWLGTLALFVMTGVGRFIFVGIPVIVLVGFILYECYLTKKEAKEKGEESSSAEETKN